MPFCPTCGETLEQDSAFCTQCGSRISKGPPKAVTIAKGAIDKIFGEEVKSVYLDDEVLTQIQGIVTNASRWVVFVTPYVGLWVHLKNAMEEAVSRGVTISFVVRAGEEKQAQELKWLREHGIRVYETLNLHAKIYLNERDVLVSSMNIYGSSTLNSLDFGLLVRNEEDAGRLREYVNHLIRKLTPPSRSEPAVRKAAQMAFCIRDANRMTFNAVKPLCDKCYPKWARYKNRNYQESYCHSCGKSVETTFARPFCSDCYKKLKLNSSLARPM
jgi:phosphatidylserine/phosphatidylglycerophosphate/cardiolipin synthase-like enzyme